MVQFSSVKIIRVDFLAIFGRKSYQSRRNHIPVHSNIKEHEMNNRLLYTNKHPIKVDINQW